MGQYPLLATKLYIPPVWRDPSTPLWTGPSTPHVSSGLRGRLVSRPRLIERLQAGLYGKLTLVSAPAGFGKTTLVSECVAKLRSDAAKENQTVREAAWLSLDENDNDPARFLVYIIAALRTLGLSQVEGMEAKFGEGMLSALQSPSHRRPRPS